MWWGSVAGGVAGLFAARVVLEAIRLPWAAALILPIGLVGGLSGLGLARTARERSLWPALLLLPYVVWPWRDPRVAAALALLAGLTWLVLSTPRSLFHPVPLTVDALTFAIALAAYVATTAPGVLPADAGEFQLVATRLGVAHPPGYPLYTLVGHLFVRLLPWGTPAYRLNLLSGLLAAATLVLVARATRRWAQQLGATPALQLAGGLGAALALGTATTFWAQATIANVRTPLAFFTALALLALARFATASGRRQADRALVLLGLALGLGIPHHPSLIFLALFFLIYLLLVEPRLALQPRRWVRPALAALVGLLPLLYLPIRGRMGAPLAPPGLDTLPGFLNHFLARGFAGDMFAFANARDLPHRLALLPTLLPFQFNLLLLGMALVGVIGLVWRERRLFVLLAGGLALHTFVAITYRAPQTVEYMMPAYLPLAVAVGLAPAVFRVERRSVRSLLAAGVMWAGVLNGAAHAPSFAALAQDHATREWVEPLLESAPDGALILADWRWATPTWYLQQVEGLRPDVEVEYVWPVRGEAYRDTWLRRAGEAEPGQAVLLTHAYTFDGYTSEPFATGFLLSPRPVDRPSAPLTPLEATFGERVQLVGYNTSSQAPRPGQSVEVTLAWRAAAPLERAPSFTLLLMDETGQVLAHADRALPTDTQPGEVRFERLFLPFYPFLASGRYRLALGAYAVTEAGFEGLPAADGAAAVPLTHVDLAPSTRAPFTLHRRALSFAGGPALVGVDYDRSVPSALRLYLRWQGPAQAGTQVQLQVGGEVVGSASLPPLPAGTYHTLAFDLPATVDAAPRLSLLDPQGRVRRAAGPWGWGMESARLPAPARGARFVPLGEEMALTGVRARPAAPGQEMVVDAELVGLRPLTLDVSTSVRLFGEDGRWLAQHDSQPGLGAVPTLKWIAGSRVVDRHLLPVPADFSEASLWATMVAYERFRAVPLLPMDGRFDAVPLGSWPQID